MGSLYIGDVEVIGGGGGGGGGKYVDVLVVGGGGGGGGSYGTGGGAGGLIECKRYAVLDSSISVSVGCGGSGTYNNVGCDGGDSCFDNLIAYGGGAGVCGNLNGHAGGNGGGGSNGISVQANTLGMPGGPAKNFGGHQGGGGKGGGGGAGGDGGYGLGGKTCCWGGLGLGGQGLYNDFTGEGCYYSGGGNAYAVASGSSYNPGQYVICGASYCGGGGHGAYQTGCAGKNGVVVVRYPTDGSYGISSATGGCKYTCGDYTIHCFTSNGTFTIN